MLAKIYFIHQIIICLAKFKINEQDKLVHNWKVHSELRSQVQFSYQLGNMATQVDLPIILNYIL